MHATYTCAYAKHHTQDYKSIISSLPETDQPSFFGLPANIERSSQRTISSRVISQLKVVTRMGDVEGKFDRETWATELSPILTLWKRLNQVSPVVRFSLFSIVLPSSPLHMPHTSICHTPAEYYYSSPSITLTITTTHVLPSSLFHIYAFTITTAHHINPQPSSLHTQHTYYQTCNAHIYNLPL